MTKWVKWSLTGLCFPQIDTKFSTKEQRFPKIGTNLWILSHLQFNIMNALQDDNAQGAIVNCLYACPFEFKACTSVISDLYDKETITLSVCFASFA